MICVRSVSVSPGSISLNVGEWGSASATVSPSNATNKTLSWSSSNSSVASVSSGSIYGRSAGSATIYARATDGSGEQDSCSVTVSPQTVYVSSVTLSSSSISLQAGSSSYLSATVSPSNATNKTLSWSSSNSSVASVSSGSIYGRSAGSATIYATATDGSGAQDSCSVTVTPQTVLVNSVTLSSTSLSLQQGNTANLTATVCPTNATNKTLSWSTSNSSVATVSGGVVTARAGGTATIYATATDGSGKRGSCSVTVIQNILVSSITLNNTCFSLHKGFGSTLTATVCPADATNKTLSWSSSNTSVATVSGGDVTGIAAGTATITASATDGSGITGTCSVTVYEDILVTSVTVCPECKTMIIGQSAFLSETVCPENATNKCVTWSSSNTAVATVNPTSGLVMAQAAGSATIYATAQDGSGKSGSCAVTVNASVLVSSVTVCPANVTFYGGDSTFLTATICPENATNKAVTWRSNDSGIAQVNATNGQVTAKSIGTTAVYARALDGSGITGYCTIIVKSTYISSKEKEPENETEGSTKADPVDIYSGAHLLKKTLISLFGGQALSLTAQYNSTELCTGSLGIGWYHNYEKYLDISANEILAYDNPTNYLKFVVTNNSTVFNCSTPEKTGYVLTVDTNSYDYPYCVNCNYERFEYYNIAGLLVKVVDHQGYETTITYTDSLVTITDTVTGKRIYLEKTSGKITRVYDDSSRQAVLTYNGNFLTNICDVNGNNLSYAYDDIGRVLYGTDSKNTRYFENTYDDYGRVISQKDGVGTTPTLFAYGENGARTVTNRNGDTSTRVFNDNGLLTAYTDENGNVKTYSYDSNFNIIEETDGLGNSIEKVYNSFNKPTSVTDKNGNTTTVTYDSAGNITRINYPEINSVVPTETFAYNSRNQLTSHTDLRGTVTAYTYDANGLPLTKTIGSRNPIQYVYTNGRLISQTDARGNTITYGYNALGQVTSQTDAENNTTSYVYDLSGNLLTTTDPDSHTITNTYDGNYQKTSVTDANGNITGYSYNGNMKNTSVTLPDGNDIRYEYDNEDRLVRITDQADNITLIQYDAGGRVTSKQSPDNGTFTFTYDAAGNALTVTNPKGAATTKTYDANGNVLTETDDNNHVTSYQYDCMSRLVRKVNASSGVTLYSYSAAGDLLCETDALGKIKRYTYDAFGNKLTFIDALSNTTVYTYDANNNLLTVRDALNNTTTYTYNSLNQLLTITDAKNHTVTCGYDALGRRTTITDAKNNVFTTVYDGNGNVLSVVDANNNTVSETTYNSLNLPASVTDASGKTTTYTYNSLGKVSVAVDSLNNRQAYTYNSMGRNTQVEDALNNFSSATYDTLGNVTYLAGPLGGSTTYSYDDIGRLISESTTSGGTVSYGYNELNLKNLVTNAKNQNRTYYYNSLGRITGYISPEGSVSYTYDDNGNVLTVTDGNGTVTRTYDALNRVITCTDTYNKTITYVYDAVGNLSRIIYPDNTYVSYAYDENNNLVTVTDWSNRVTSYTYDTNNRITGVTKPDGSVTTTVYDNKQRVTSSVERDSQNAVITGYEYTYDDLGRISSEEVLDKNTRMCYTYDNLSRVTVRTTINLSDNTQTQETFTYNAAGNITGDSSGNTFVYDTNNRLTSYNSQPVTYDADGNMLSSTLGGNAVAFVYDSANRLISAGGNAYTYNAEDVRIRNLCGTVDTSYTYDTNARLSRLLVKTTNNVVTKYVYGLGLIGEETSGSFKTYHFDYRGSTVAITDSTGAVTDTFAYDTYGRLTARTGTSTVIFGYNGRDGVVTDANGLIYMRARYYSPELRRFVNADIIAGGISEAVTLNRYAYANGNPVSNIDPFGLCTRDTDENNEDPSNFPHDNNDLYKLLKSWGIDLTKSGYNSDDIINIAGGFIVRIKYEVTYKNPYDTNVSTDISLDSGNMTHEITTPEIRLPWENVGTKYGVYTDEESLSVGASYVVSNGQYTNEKKHQVGLCSEVDITSFSYTPSDVNLPTVKVTYEVETTHLFKATVAGGILAAVYAPPVVIAEGPVIIQAMQQFIAQLGQLQPSF